MADKSSKPVRFVCHMVSLAKNLRRDQAGTVGLIIGIALPVIIGAAGLAVDVGMWYSDKRQLQSVADASALGGAYQIYLGQTNYSAGASASAAKNGFNTDASHVLTVNNPPTSGAYTGDAKAVEAIATRPSSLVFTRIFLGTPPTVLARAVATEVQDSEFCILGLNPTAPLTVEATGNGTIHLGCGVASNSTDPTSLDVQGSAILGVTQVTVAGDVNVQGHGTLDNSGPQQIHHPAIDDPLASIPEPTPTLPPDQTLPDKNAVKNGTAYLSPGTYANLDLTGWSNTSVVLSPGIYVIAGGDFAANSNITSISGDGVTIVLAPDAGGHVGSFQLNGTSTVSLNAPASGTYAGVLIYQSHSAPVNDKLNANQVNGNNTWGLTGTLYFPNQQLTFQGNSTSSNGCTHIIARDILMTGDANFFNNTCPTGTPKIVTNKVILVE